MTPDEFGGWLTERLPSLDAWGRHVVRTIDERVKGLIGEVRHRNFFKVPPGFRVKDVASAVKKQEKKRYDDPANKMT